MDALRPTTEAELVDIIAAAVADRVPLAPTGQGTKAGIGRPVQHPRLELGGLCGVTLYEPEELVVSAKAGTPVDDVVAMLAEKGQELAFEPPRWRMPDGAASRGSIGGLVAANFSGPRRLKAGAVRDHILGVRAVSGRAEAFKAGGKVVKNVTGYDLARGLAGSWGTLAVLTEVTFKVLPKAETVRTVCVGGIHLAEAMALMTEALQLPFDVSGAVCFRGFDGAWPFTVALRIEGFEASVAARVDGARKLASQYGRPEVWPEDMSDQIWGGGFAVPLDATVRGRALWRVSIPPASAVKLTELVDAGLPSGCEPANFTYDWSGGLVWVEVDARLPDLGAAAIRAAIAANGGGHATLIHGPAEARGRIEVFQPQPEPLAALSRRLKAQFDPAGILNPGRMWAG